MGKEENVDSAAGNDNRKRSERGTETHPLGMKKRAGTANGQGPDDRLAGGREEEDTACVRKGRKAGWEVPFAPPFSSLPLLSPLPSDLDQGSKLAGIA